LSANRWFVRLVPINFAVAPASFRQLSGCKEVSLMTEMLGIFIGEDHFGQLVGISKFMP
jgi:hypothetical protein